MFIISQQRRKYTPEHREEVARIVIKFRPVNRVESVYNRRRFHSALDVRSPVEFENIINNPYLPKGDYPQLLLVNWPQLVGNFIFKLFMFCTFPKFFLLFCNFAIYIFHSSCRNPCFILRLTN